MNAFEYIITKQISWAKNNKISLIGSKIVKGREAYTKTIEENLFEPLYTKTRLEIENGDGGELKSNSSSAAKICAVHSSSAIGVNVFQYWKNRNIPDLAYHLGLCSINSNSAKEIHFEQKFIINEKFGYSPNIDIIIKNNVVDKIKVFAVECKFSEAYSARKHCGLKEKYLTGINEQWNDIPNLYEFAKTISPTDTFFKHLHPAQLIKHILGLKKTYGKSGFRLLYLWYDVLGKDGFQHRKEILEFTNIAKRDKIMFHSLSYQELILKMQRNLYNGNEQYIDYLTNRYL